jgi:molybdopterin converting factor small subunit
MCEVVLEDWTGMGYAIPAKQKTEDGTTIEKLLSQLGLSEKYGYFSILLNGKTVPLNTVLKDGDKLVLIPLMTAG